MLPGGFFGPQLFAAAPGQRVDLHRASALGLAPLGGNPAGLFEFEQRRIERALIQREMVAADLFDSPGDPVAVERAERFKRLEDDESQTAVQHVGAFGGHVLAGYTCTCCLSTAAYHVLGS